MSLSSKIIIIVLFAGYIYADTGDNIKILKSMYENTLNQLDATTMQSIRNNLLIVKKEDKIIAVVNNPVLNKSISDTTKEAIHNFIPEPQPRKYSFSKVSVWGDSSVDITAFNSYFIVKCKCTSPVVYYSVIDPNNSIVCEATIENKNGVNDFTVKIDKIFIPCYKLQLRVKSEGLVNTVEISLFNKNEINTK